MEMMSDKITVAGLGQCGVKIVSSLSKLDGAGTLRLLAFDTDVQSINACPLPEENKLLVGFERMRHGCGGNVSAGNSAFGHNRSDISRLIKDSKMLIVVGGLGGGTATGGLPIIASYTKDIPCLFVLSLPFSWEGQGRMRMAEKALVDELLPRQNVAVMTLPNDLLFSQIDSNMPLAESFELAQREIANAVMALATVLTAPEGLPVGFATFKNILHKRKSFTAIGVGRSGNSSLGSADRCLLALDKMLHSPLLGDLERLTEADCVVFALLGGADLTLGESRQALDGAIKLARTGAQTIVCTGRCDELKDEVLFACFAVKFDISEEELSKIKTQQNRRTRLSASTPAAQQLTLEFENSGRGIMEGTRRTFENEEDLDVPTFRRHQLSVDTGVDT